MALWGAHSVLGENMKYFVEEVRFMKIHITYEKDLRWFGEMVNI